MTTRCMCSECNVDGVILCTATTSIQVAGVWYCDKGELTEEQAKERKERIDRIWIKTS